MTEQRLILLLIWLVLTGAGLCLTSYMMWVSWGDIKNLKRAGLNGELQSLARLTMWQEARRFAIKIVLFSIGVAAFFEKPQHPNEKTDGFGWFFVIVLYGSVMLLNYSSLAAIRYRKKFIRNRTLLDRRDDRIDSSGNRTNSAGESRLGG